MGHRPHVYKSVQLPAEPGESPNAHVPWVTAEVRVFWPAADPGKAWTAFEQVVTEARAELPPEDLTAKGDRLRREWLEAQRAFFFFRQDHPDYRDPGQRQALHVVPDQDDETPPGS